MADDVKKPVRRTAPTAKTAKTATAAKAKPKASPKAAGTHKKTAEPAPESIASATEALKATASKLGKQASDKARDYVSEGKARAGGALDEVSRMMGEAAGTVHDRLGPEYAKYAHNAAEAISGWSEKIKGKEMEDLLGDARDFMKKSPVVAIGVAAALGFVVARLFRSGIDSDPKA
jgi:ElaB/YqjD/DUF883 family membrane-anchored ribosome-binding protein